MIKEGIKKVNSYYPDFDVHIKQNRRDKIVIIVRKEKIY